MLLNYEYIIIKIICNIITHFTADFAPSKTISFLPVDIYMQHSLTTIRTFFHIVAI